MNGGLVENRTLRQGLNEACISLDRDEDPSGYSGCYNKSIYPLHHCKPYHTS